MFYFHNRVHRRLCKAVLRNKNSYLKEQQLKILGHLVCFICPSEELTDCIENICKRWIVSEGLLKQDSQIVSTAINQILLFTSKQHFISTSCLHKRDKPKKHVSIYIPHSVYFAFRNENTDTDSALYLT